MLHCNIKTLIECLEDFSSNHWFNGVATFGLAVPDFGEEFVHSLWLERRGSRAECSLGSHQLVHISKSESDPIPG
jgi:hypothetical protein